MRFWEIVLVVVNFGLLYGVIMKRKKVGPAIGSLWTLAVAYLAAIVQASVEGASWRMIPAYLTLILLTAYLYVGRDKTKSRKWYTVTIQTVLLTIYLAIAIIPPVAMPIFSFAKLSGSYPVGTMTYHWIDEKRTETWSDVSRTKRELMVQMWYPALEGSGKKPARYVENSPEVKAALAEQFGLPAFAMGHLGLVRTHARPEATLSEAQWRYPVLVFSHGMGGNRNQNTFEVEELASRGYIVVGIDHAYQSGATVYPDGRTAKFNIENQPTTKAGFDELMSVWTADAAFVLDQLERLNRGGESDRFANRLDLVRIGMFGHSYGGAAAAQMLARDARVKAAIDMDGGMFGEPLPAGGVGKPFLLMNAQGTLDADRFEEGLDSSTREELYEITGRNREAVEKDFYDLMRRFKDAVANDGFSMVIPHSTHISFSDYSLYSLLFRAKGEQPKQIHRIVNEFTLAFFERYLNGADDSVLRQLDAKYPEVNFKTNK
ncbi:alpha/beta hydrolase family protein [Cohnella herbarum]|uniref:Carboxylic ester hydrolase n=1 Tax=Cohnella herbarum TaxID=2728023 RepID=A0A7Z2VQF5_9BACL|nr:alpha/beta fold hydrolase [Cohnella herbarum]QJD87212.1 carboxylic ester hydrolase [Cohnella herbarum]